VAYHLEKIYDSMPMMNGVRVASVGYIGVEFFFILAGFLIAQSDSRRRLAGAPERVTFQEAGRAGVKYVLGKLKVVYPTLIAVLLLFTLVLHSGGIGARLREITNLEWELLMLGGTNFGWNESDLFLIVSWFLTDIILTGYIFTIIVSLRRDVVRYLAPVMAVLLYAFFSAHTFELYRGHDLMGFLNGGMIRAFAGMCLGYTAHMLYTRLAGIKLHLAAKILLSLLELYVIYRLVALCWKQPIDVQNFRILVYIPLIIMFAFLQQTAVSFVLNNPVSRFLGGVSLTMYLFHWRFLEYYYTLKMKYLMSYKGLSAISKIFGATYTSVQKLVTKPMFDVVAYIVSVTICSIALSYIVKLAVFGLGKIRSGHIRRVSLAKAAREARLAPVSDAESVTEPRNEG
jgi:peptidoglycan/LPS O-acetylase OafA/YrhL